jgi:hypothetical protein
MMRNGRLAGTLWPAPRGAGPLEPTQRRTLGPAPHGRSDRLLTGARTGSSRALGPAPHGRSDRRLTGARTGSSRALRPAPHGRSDRLLTGARTGSSRALRPAPHGRSDRRLTGARTGAARAASTGAYRGDHTGAASRLDRRLTGRFDRRLTGRFDRRLRGRFDRRLRAPGGSAATRRILILSHPLSGRQRFAVTKCGKRETSGRGPSRRVNPGQSSHRRNGTVTGGNATVTYYDIHASYHGLPSSGPPAAVWELGRCR